MVSPDSNLPLPEKLLELKDGWSINEASSKNECLGNDMQVLKKDEGTFLSFDHRNSSCNSDFVDNLEPLMVKDSYNVVKYGKGTGINGRNNADKVDAHNMFDEMSLNIFLTKHGTVKEYFDSFNSWFSKMALEEWYRVNLFICRLPLEFGNGVRLFNPKTLSDAYCLAKLQEFTHNDMINNSKRPLLNSSKSKV
ncbi:hypothetical protein Tco_0365908 [Tanacetum coccineum]